MRTSARHEGLFVCFVFCKHGTLCRHSPISYPSHTHDGVGHTIHACAMRVDRHVSYARRTIYFFITHPGRVHVLPVRFHSCCTALHSRTHTVLFSYVCIYAVAVST